MNRLLCFLTGGHKFSDANLKSEMLPDDNRFVILTNSCVKCGDVYAVRMNVEEQLKKDKAEKALKGGAE